MKDKYYFLLYFPILWIFPPSHEMVHALVAWAFGVEVTGIEFGWTSYTYLSTKGSSLHWFIQHSVWDSYYVMTALCVVCIVSFTYYCLKAHHVVINVNWDKIRRDLHIEES